jgi:hypothetical protein
VGTLRRPLGFPAANRNPQQAMHTSRLTRVPGDPVLVQKIFAPTPALQAYSSLHSSKSGRRLRVSGRPEVSPWNTRATGGAKAGFRGVRERAWLNLRGRQVPRGPRGRRPAATDETRPTSRGQGVRVAFCSSGLACKFGETARTSSCDPPPALPSSRMCPGRSRIRDRPDNREACYLKSGIRVRPYRLAA